MNRSSLFLRHKRWVLIAGILGVVGISGIVFKLVRREEPLPTMAEVMASAATEPVAIIVGPNVQVSTANAANSHREVVAVADPTDPKKLVAAAMCLQPGDRFAVIAYRSEDGGATWQPSFRRDDPAVQQADPAFAFGPDGLLYFVFQTLSWPAPASGPMLTDFRFFRSPDAGQSWEAGGIATGPRTHTEGIDIDRPFLATDRTNGPFRGHLYCVSNYTNFHDSGDGGRTFRRQKYEMPVENMSLQTSNPVVLSDGTMVFTHLDWRQSRREPIGLGVIASDDGGKTLRPQARVIARWRDEARRTDPYCFIPVLAADARDRLFAVWEDGNHPGRGRLLFARSEDKGRTWTRPAIISEQPADGTGGYIAVMPAIAVNKDGVIGVSWYDRRGLPDVDLSNHASNNRGTGCNVRLRVSLDGGDTWQPSVQVNQAPIKAKVWDLRDTAGLAADADGAFHPFWIDDRTGILQVWTAAVTVGRK